MRETQSNCQSRSCFEQAVMAERFLMQPKVRLHMLSQLAAVAQLVQPIRPTFER